MGTYTIRHHTEETDCEWCGCPLMVGDRALMMKEENVVCGSGCAAKLAVNLSDIPKNS